MKKMMIVIVSLFITQIIQAQGTITYLSDLDQPSAGSEMVGSDSWLAADFLTGGNVSGYMFDSVQLAMADATGNPNGFTVMIYTGILGGAVLPGTSLGTLSGSDNPSTAGIYTYTPATDITLLPNINYFIVATAGTAVATGAYEWSVTDTPTVNLNGWSGNTSLSYSNDGSSWHFFSGTLAQFAITATPIPEPSPSWLFLLGSGVFIYVRRTFHR